MENSSASENSLHLDFNASLNLNDLSTNEAADSTVSASGEDAPAESKDRKKPYVNPERVKTGGSQRDKLSEEELTERMKKMREQNEKIKQRRVDVQADEEAFRKTQEVEKAKLARNRKVQESVDTAREQNAKRKMEKVQSREWDSGKPSAADWKARGQPTTNPPKDDGDASSVASNQWGRGASPGRGNRGRGRGRGGPGSRRGGRPTSPSAEVSEPISEEIPENPSPPPTL